MSGYRGVLLAESLTNTTVLDEIDIVSQERKAEAAPSEEQPEVWTWYHMRVPVARVEAVAKSLSMALKPRAWYTNLWIEGDYLLIFPGRVFRGSSISDSVWEQAIEYGLSIGVPYAQLTPLYDILQTE